jgi:hypothetical protein
MALVLLTIFDAQGRDGVEDNGLRLIDRWMLPH